MESIANVYRSTINSGKYLVAEMQEKLAILGTRGLLTNAELTELLALAETSADPDYTGKSEELTRIEALEAAVLDLIDLVIANLPDDAFTEGIPS